MTPINTALCNILNYYTDLFIFQSREEKLGKNKKNYNKKRCLICAQKKN